MKRKRSCTSYNASYTPIMCTEMMPNAVSTPWAIRESMTALPPLMRAKVHLHVSFVALWLLPELLRQQFMGPLQQPLQFA